MQESDLVRPYVYPWVLAFMCKAMITLVCLNASYSRLHVARADDLLESHNERRSEKRVAYEINNHSYRVVPDLTTQVLLLSAPEERGHVSGSDDTADLARCLYATPAEILQDEFVSASVLAQKAKHFDDGLCATIELAAQKGAGTFAGKAFLLKQLVKALGSGHPPLADTSSWVIFAGAKLGGLEVETPGAFQAMVDDGIAAFLKDPMRSKPLAFYGEKNELSAIFRQDRMLQTELKDRAGIMAIAEALQNDEPAKAAYDSYLSLVAGLTNPPAQSDLRATVVALKQGRAELPAKDVYFFPPSRSHETELVKRLFGNSSVPEGFNLADKMIQTVRSGEVSLKLTDQSGWHDYQTWAVEPLILPEKTPEATRLRFGDDYYRCLFDLFKAILTLTRETHVKQLDQPRTVAAPPRQGIEIRPRLTVEPLATYYLRRAQGYRFVRGILERVFGAEALRKMHRQLGDSVVADDLEDELRGMERLFCGAYLTVCQEIGLEPVRLEPLGFEADRSVHTARFQQWQQNVKTDQDIAQDSRIMVPVFYDVERRKIKVWVLLGWTTRPLVVQFFKKPRTVVFDQAGHPCPSDRPELMFGPSHYDLLYPVTAELYVETLLDRDEIRTLCDRYKNRSAILSHLK